MTPVEANTIINKYGSVLANENNRGTAWKLSWLPCSICKIRLAFFVFIEELIADNAFTQELGDQLKLSYHGLNKFIADDDADTINLILSQMKSQGQETLSESQKQLLSQFCQRVSQNAYIFELNSYVNECFGKRDNQDFVLSK